MPESPAQSPPSQSRQSSPSAKFSFNPDICWKPDDNTVLYQRLHGVDRVVNVPLTPKLRPKPTFPITSKLSLCTWGCVSTWMQAVSGTALLC